MTETFDTDGNVTKTKVENYNDDYLLFNNKAILKTIMLVVSIAMPMGFTIIKIAQMML